MTRFSRDKHEVRTVWRKNRKNLARAPGAVGFRNPQGAVRLTPAAFLLLKRRAPLILGTAQTKGAGSNDDACDRKGRF
jgi:hypothetical protein